MVLGLINKGISTLLSGPKAAPVVVPTPQPTPHTTTTSTTTTNTTNSGTNTTTVTTTTTTRVGPHVAIMNMSTVATDAQLQPIVAALQIQLDRDFAPAWGISATLSYVAKGGTAPTNAWQLQIQDNTNQQGALGYHELTNAGNPIAYVFAETDKQYGLSLSVTISHELLEMLVDPDINLTAFVQTTNTAGVLYAYEVCDAVEDDSIGYQINNILVSDFVYPAWFESFRTTNSTQFDFQHKVTKPFQLYSGGYIGLFDVKKGTGWQQATAQEAPTQRALARQAKGQYARMNRRKTFSE